MTLILEGQDREALLKHSYDQEMGFGRWHKRCQSVFEQAKGLKEEPSARSTHDLDVKGYEFVNALTPGQCQETIDACRSVEQERSVVSEAEYQYQFQMEDEQLESNYRLIFASEIARKITAFFKAHFFIWSVGVIKTKPYSGDSIGPSFHWHRDFGPSAHLKLLVYLNGFDEHGGATQLMSIVDTQRVRRCGYSFPVLEGRQTDISYFAQQANIDYPPGIPSLHTGEAVLFRPFDVLHKAVFPNKGPRYMISMIILPSKRPWMEALRLWPISLQQMCHGKQFDLPSILQKMI